MALITSKSNEIIKYALNIKDKKYSRQYGQCLAESDKVISDLIDAGHQITHILVEQDKVDKFDAVLSKYHGKVTHVTAALSKMLSDSVTPSGIYACVTLPTAVGDVISGSVLVLDNLQDPSNMGAILRSALAFGFTEVLAVNCVYPYTSKVIRSSMSYVFNVHIRDVNYTELQQLVTENDIHLMCADMAGTPVHRAEFNYPRIGLVIGNEGRGVSPEIAKMCNTTLSIPMLNGVESLNASVSASILMYYISNKE